MEQWWYDTDRVKPGDLKRSLFQCYSVFHKSHMDCPGSECRPLAVFERYSQEIQVIFMTCISLYVQHFNWEVIKPRK
jgi:hypothetical protein